MGPHWGGPMDNDSVKRAAGSYLDALTGPLNSVTCGPAAGAFGDEPFSATPAVIPVPPPVTNATLPCKMLSANILSILIFGVYHGIETTDAHR